MKQVTDPTILEQLNSQTPGLKPVSDPSLLAQLEGKSTPDASWGDNLRDIVATALKIGPTALKGVADLGRLATGDRIGVDTSNAMKRGMEAIDQVIGSDALNAQKANINQALQDPNVGIMDLPGVVMRNPRAAADTAVSTVGSMFLPAGAAAGVVKALPTVAKIIPRAASVTPGAAATGASVVTGAAQNAAETFVDTEGQAMGDRYTGAGISGAASLVLGKLLGGGAEGVIARRLAGETVGRGVIEAGKSAVKTGAKEFLQEGGEESSNYVGKQTAKGEAIDLNTMGKQGLYGGMIGLGVGAGSDVATNAADIGKGGIERQVARAIDEAAQDIADRQTPQVIQQTVARIFDKLPQRPDPAPAPQPEPQPLALGFDPSVRNPQPTMQVDPQGNASPMPTDQQAAIQAEVERMNSLGLTPDVQRAAAQRAQSPEPGPVSTPSDLIQRLLGSGWTPPQQSDGMVLQNRNRATPSSVAQMTSIAANPDYGRLGFSRDFANGAPVVSGGSVPAKQIGKSDVAVASDGRRIPVQYAVVEADQVLASNKSDGTANVDYGNDQVQAIRAIAGNGRIAGLQSAYANGKASGYLKELSGDALHGIDKKVIKGMKQPVLVRIMPKESLTADIGDVSNTVGNLALSPVEQAKNDAQRVSLDALQFAEDGSVTPETVRQFVRAMPQSEQGGLLDTNGQPTKQAVDRISAAVFSRAYGNDQLVRLYAQAQDPEARLILSALAQVAPKMARLEGAGGLDIRDVVTQAAEIAVNARRDGIALAKAAQQLDMTADPLVGEVLDLFVRNSRSVKPVVEALGAAADMAYTEANKPASDMFGEVPRASRGDIINQLRPENERGSQKGLEQPAGREPVQEDAGGQAARPAGSQDAGPAQASRSAEDQADQQGLTSYTPQEIEDRLSKLEQAEKERQQQEREAEQRAKADAERDDFTLTGSDRTADVAAARGQTDIFSAPSEEQVSTKTSEKTGNTTKTYGGYVDGDGVPVELSIVRRADGTLFRVFAKYGDGTRNEFDASYGPGITDEQIVKAVAEPSDWEKVAAKSTADQASEKSKGDRFPSVESITGLRVGPGGTIKPKAIAPGKPLYRETDLEGLNDILRSDSQADVVGLFVSDNPDLAIGQGDNTGVQIVFRPDSLSGKEHVKPMTGELAGREYKTDVVAPRAVQEITMRASDLKSLRPAAKRALSDFDRSDLPGGLVRFTRKGLSNASQPQAPMPTPGMTPSEAIVNAFKIEGSTEADAKEMATRIQKLADRNGKAVTLWWNPEDGELAAMGTNPFDNGVAITTVEPTPDPRAVAKPDAPASQPKTETKAKARSDAASVSPAGRIDDFGEKIGGARKDVWTSFKDDLGAVADDDIASQPLSKVWPQPDYQALLDGGADPWAVAFARAARDEIPSKPRQSWKVKRWAEQVRSLRDSTMKLMDGRLSVERVKQLMTQFTSQGMRDLAGRVELYTLVGHGKSLDGVRIRSGEYSMYNRVEYNPPRVIWTVEKEAAATAFSNWPRELATGATREEALKAFKEKYDSLDINPAAKKEVTFDIYSKRGQDGYFIGKKVGRNYIDVAGPFENVKAAREHKATKQAELVAKLEKAKEIPRERRDTNEPRVGEDMRNGQDVTPQMFGETFGFRGVEFGNWVEQGRRQKDLNDAFDALMDMAAIIGVPPKALSLNGELGLAFGARGGGGVNPAAAHYEPGKVVINLTKKSGAGSLGHEWWHALDNYFSRMRSKGDGMMTDALDVSLAARGSPFQHQGAVRKEMVEAFGAVMKAIRQTAIKARSAKLDAKRSKEYWTTDPEMSARAFESYLISKLQDQDASNDYLANIVAPETWKAAEALGFELDDSYPYPTAGEIPAIRAGFDHFFKTIETRETDNGLMLYAPSRAASTPGKMSLDAVRQAVQTAIKTIPNAPGIEVVANPAVAGIAVGPTIRPMGGTLPDGRILLFADNIGSVIDVHQTVFHELFHRGAKVRFNRNADYIAAMLDLAATDATVRRLAVDWKKSDDGQDKREQFELNGPLTGDRLANYEALAVEEALAEIAESVGSGQVKPARSMIERITQALARVAESFGLKRLARWLREADLSAAEKFIVETVRMSGGTPNQNTTAVLFSQGSVQSAVQTWDVTEPGTGDAFIRAIQNNKIDVKRVRDAIAERYGKVAESKDAYLGEELYHGRVAARVSRIYDEQVEPLLKKIAVAGQNVGVTMDDVNLYLHARHAPERNAAMKAINPDMENNEALSGMSNQEAAKALADFKAAGKDKALALIAADVDQLLADTRTNLVADGLEDAGVIAAWESAYKHYVPLQRDIKGGGTPKGMGFSIRGPESKRAVGSNRQVVNILANVVAQAETAAIRAEKAVVGRTLLAMAKQYPNPDFWKVDIAPTKPRIDKETGLVQRNAVDPLFQTADNVVMVKDYGQEHFIVFNKNNERAMAMAHAMKNLDIAPMNKILEVANKGTRFLASLLTQRNPLFWLTNFARDIQGALVNLEGTDAEGLQREAMANLPKAFKGMHAIVRGDGSGQWARYAREFQEAGGTTGYMQVFETSDKRMADLEREVARMQQGKADPRRLARMALEFVDDYNDIIENAVRLSVFQAARDANVSTAKAASIAKNITVNFNRKGNLTPPINSLYMFFNASVQGTARLAQAMVTSRKAQALVGGIAAMGFVLDALNRMAAGDDDETKRNRYDLIPEFEKSRNWIFMNPMRPGEYVKVPLPLGPHVFHNAGRLLSDAIFRKNPRNASEYGWSIAGVFLDAFSPLGASPSLGQLISPSVLDPAVQLAENKSFTGAPVFKSADRGFGKTDPKPAYTRHFESTPDVWIGASKLLSDATGGDKVKPGAIDINPDVMKHIFYTMTGGPGRTLDQTIDTAQAGSRGKEFSVNRVPLASRFYGANDDAQRERAYYDDRKRVLDAKQTFDYYMKNGRADEARKVAAELGDGDPAKGRKKMLEFSAAEKSVRKINGSIRQELERDDDGEATAEQLRALRQRRVRVMSNALDDE